MAQRKIKSEIEDALFIAITLDETTDISNISQLSKVLRYVTRKGEIFIYGHYDGAASVRFVFVLFLIYDT